MKHFFITCISTLSSRSVPVLYNKGMIEATQTNEACCKYLLRRGPRPDYIIALCTRDAIEKTAENGSILRSYAHFEDSIRAFCEENRIPLPQIFQVRLFRKEERDNHFGKAISEVLAKIQEYGERQDTRIMVDTAGGPRNISIMMQTMTRLLHYYGYDRVDAYYTNLTEHRIFHDHTNQQLAVTEAIASFVEHGTAHQLAEYFRDSKCEEVRRLVDAMKAFSDSIQLCQTERLPDIINQQIFPALDQIAALRGAQANKEDIAALQQMVDYIRYRFGYNPLALQPVTPLSLIRWCLQCGYVQQAVTLFTENIPKYLVDSGTLTVSHPEKYLGENGSSQYVTWVYRYLVGSCKPQRAVRLDKVSFKVECIKNFTAFNMHCALPDFRLNIPRSSEGSFRAFLVYYVYIKNNIRNRLNHAVEEENELSQNQKHALKQFGIDTSELTPDNITANVLAALRQLEVCLQS